MQAIAAGIFNDLGSGSNVDITVIRAADTPAGQPSVEHKRGYQVRSAGACIIYRNMGSSCCRY